MIEQHFGRCCVEPENTDTRVRRQMKFRVAHADRLPQARADPRDTRFDSITIRALHDEREQALAQLTEVPHRLVAGNVTGLYREAKNRHAHDLL